MITIYEKEILVMKTESAEFSSNIIYFNPYVRILSKEFKTNFV